MGTKFRRPLALRPGANSRRLACAVVMVVILVAIVVWQVNSPHDASSIANKLSDADVTQQHGSYPKCTSADAAALFLHKAEKSYAQSLKERKSRMSNTLPPPEEFAAAAEAAMDGDSTKYPFPPFPQFEARMLVPTFSCAVEERLGHWGSGPTEQKKGGLWVCLSYCGHRTERPPVVMTIGQGLIDTSFEDDARSVLLARLHLFDPTLPENLASKTSSEHLTIHKNTGVVGKTLLAEAKEMDPSSTWYTLRQARKQVLKVKYVDFLKLDCDGCEHAIVEELASSKVYSEKRQPFGQILMRVPNVRDVLRTMALLLRLESMGYRLFHSERDSYNLTTYTLSFIHQRLVTAPEPDANPMTRPSPFLCADHDALAKLLSSADESFVRNIQRRQEALGRSTSGSGVGTELLASGLELDQLKLESVILSPPYSCLNEARLGVWGEGGKWACLGFCQPQRTKVPLVVSIGCNGDGSFEAGVFYYLRTVPHTFDPFIPDKVQWMSSVRHMQFHDMGLTGSSNLGKSVQAHPQAKWVSFKGMLDYLSVSYIDLFKIDCEGCELAVVEELKETYTRETAPIGVIMMEVHDTKSVPPIMQMLLTLEDLGYRMYHVEVNAYCRLCFEVAYVHESLLTPPALGSVEKASGAAMLKGGEGAAEPAEEKGEGGEDKAEVKVEEATDQTDEASSNPEDVLESHEP